MDHPPVTVSIVGEVDEPNYPLNALSDLLYQVLDDLAELEQEHDVDVPLPQVREYKSDFGSISINLYHKIR